MKKIYSGISESDIILMKELLPKECYYVPKSETLDRLFAKGDTIVLEKNDALIDPDKFDPNLYIVIDGMIRCWYWNGGKEETAFFSTIPTVFFNYHSYYGGKGSFYCYEACCNTRVIRILKHDYERMIKESHDFVCWILALTQRQSYYFELKIRRNLGNAKERYETMMEKIPTICKAVPLGMVASYLRISQQYLSKLRNEKK